MSLQASGKVYEKRIAKIIGGTHIERPNYGQSAPDVTTDDLVIEAKLRKDLALETWLTQCEKHQEPGKICAVFAKAKNLSDSKTIVCIRLPDFQRLMDALRDSRL